MQNRDGKYNEWYNRAEIKGVPFGKSEEQAQITTYGTESFIHGIDAAMLESGQITSNCYS